MDATVEVIRTELGRSAVSSRRVDNVLRWLTAQQQSGSRFTIGIEGANSSVFNQWLGSRVAWWPRGIPTGHRVGIVSSRLGRRLDQKAAWFAALRDALRQLPASDLLVSSPRTTTDRFIERGAELFCNRLLRILISDGRVSLDRWLQQLQRQPEHPPSHYKVHLSPPLLESPQPAAELWALPQRDRAVVVGSDRLLVLHLRPSGQMQQLIQRRLDEPTLPTASVYAAIGTQLVDEQTALDLIRQGASGWLVSDSERSRPLPSAAAKESPNSSATSLSPNPSIVSVSSTPEWPYLSHCTRRRQGPWPDQCESDYLDELLLSESPVEHSSFAGLQRIVTQRKLIGSGAAIRGGIRVVSWTSVTLTQLATLRKYRQHRLRWDFEPYGISVRRDWLESHGAHPVRYGKQQTWSSLPPAERPFFQLSQTTARSENPIDWTVEHEWRTLGDFELNGIPRDAAILFVPSIDEAHQLSAISPWPVMVLEAE